ncbi:hypothetical protein bpmyx0001_13730 [Bacillus pseudomycoides DSM 12442]|nr:hypothetical protein [Bacillus pseudomycoides]EEM17735.1 hypothetical protein bpmyx0001_13730 [Bacillus pseudomycoides DSM 12442]
MYPPRTMKRKGEDEMNKIIEVDKVTKCYETFKALSLKVKK